MEYRRLYIAYGSNINLEQMAYRCPNSKIVSKEMLKGYELEFRGVATIVPNDKSEWFCQYHLTHFIRTRIMQRERYDHSRAFFGLPEADHRWRCRFFC